MAKTNNTGIYPLEVLPTLLDFLLGTKEVNGKTKNFSLNAIIQLINGVNGKNNIQFKFSDGTDDEVDNFTPGRFFTDTNETNPSNFTKLILNKQSLQPIDLSLLFERLLELENVVLKLDNPENPNNFLNFRIKSIDNETEFFVFDVEIFNDFYLGELLNNTTYSFYFDIKEDLSDKLDKDGYVGTAKTLDEKINKKEDSINKVQNIEINKTSTTAFGSVKAFYDWCLGKFKKKLIDIKDITHLTEFIYGEQMYVPLPTDEKLFYNGTTDIRILLKEDINETVPIPVGTRFEVTSTGRGGIGVFMEDAYWTGDDQSKTAKLSTIILIKTAPNNWNIEFINSNMYIYEPSNITENLDFWHVNRRIVTKNDNPVTFNLYTNSNRQVQIGSKIEYTQKGNGVITLVPLLGVSVVTNLPLSTVKGETRTLTKIGTDTWTLEGNMPISGTRVPRTYYVNGISGSNSKGVYEDSTRPYLTVDYVLTSANFKDGDIIFLETPTTFAITAIIPFMNCTFKSDVACILTLAGNANVKLANDTTSGHLMFDIPNGTLDLRSSVAKTAGEWSSIITMNVSNLKSDATFYCNVFYQVNLKVISIFTHNGGALFAQTNLAGTNNVFINGISSSTSATLFAGGTHAFSNIEFNYISCTNSSTTYSLAPYLGNGFKILHGDIYVTSTSGYSFIGASSLTVKQEIIFKGMATVSGNCVYYAYRGLTNVTGHCTFTNNQQMFYATAAARAEKIQFHNATIFSKGPLIRDNGRGLDPTVFGVTFINCTIYVDNALIYGYNEVNGGNVAFVNAPVIKFIGTNVIYCTVSTANCISFNNGLGTYSNAILERVGTLTMNGSINNGITVNNLL
jgi:hypothetical protein